MSTIIKFLETNRKRGLLWWLSFFYKEFISNLYLRKLSNKKDNSWKNLNVKSTYFPENYPVKGTSNEKLAYFCANTEKKIWKRN
jgi:hypothetical protein